MSSEQQLPAVLVTRPEQAAEMFAGFLRHNDYVSSVLPMLDILPLSESELIASVQNTVQNLDQFYAVIFISMNAVAYGMALIDQYWPQFPVGVQIFAIGSATAKALTAWDIEAQQATIANGNESDDAINGAMNSEALLALPALAEKNITSKKILIVKGVGGREYLADELRQRGAKVSSLACYRRQASQLGVNEVQKVLAQQSVWVLTATSGESLKNLQSLLQPEQLQWPIVVPGHRVAELASEIGFKRVIQAENASMPAMLAAIKQV